MKKNNPIVSVIIPTYNRANLLSRTVRSALNQTLQDFELIIIDDGSIDNTEEVVKNFQGKDQRVKYIKHEKNKGGGVARNTGLKNAKGKYIAFLDSDDEWWFPEKLEKCYSLAGKKNDFVFHQCIKYLPRGKKIIPLKGIKKGKNVLEYLFLDKGEFQTSTFFIKKSILENNNIFFDEKLKKHQDWDLAIRLKKIVDFYFIKEPLSIWHDKDINKGKVSKKFDIDTSLYFIDKHQDLFSKNEKILSSFYCQIGTWGLRARKIKTARKFFKKSFLACFNKKAFFLYLSSFLGLNFLRLLFYINSFYRKTSTPF